MNSMMHNVLIRPAVMSERQALEALQRRASLNNPGDRDALLANVPREGPEMDLDGLFVEPHLWRHGIGRLLVEYSAVFAREQGADVLHVVGNPHAQEFYRSCGFEVLGTVPTRFGVGLSFRRMV
jgi:GNAT superfamily N-acetyltransferase